MGRVFTIIPLVFFMIILSVAVSWGGVTFKNNGKPGTTFNGKDLKHLVATISLPKKLKEYKFDQVRVLLKLSHLDVDGIIFSDRVDLPVTWGNSNVLTVNMVSEDGTSEFEDTSGGVFGLKDFTTTPQKQKLPHMTATVQIKTYTKTGEKWQTWWDRMSRSWKSSSRPVYNAGTVITEGTMTVTLEKLTGFTDTNGVISMELPDDAWSGDTYTWKDLPGERRQFTEIRLVRSAGGVIPVDAAVNAFAFDLNDWPELNDKGWSTLQQSVKADFSNTKNEAQLGWNRIVPSESIGDERAAQIQSGVWSNTFVAGQPGLKASFVEKETYSKKLYAPLYLTVRPPYVIAAWHSYKDGYYDKRMGKDIKLSPAQKQEITASLEQVISKIKPLKGGSPTEAWTPTIDAPPASPQAPFKAGDIVMARKKTGRWEVAKVVQTRINKREQFEFEVEFEATYGAAATLSWLGSHEIKTGEVKPKR